MSVLPPPSPHFNNKITRLAPTLQFDWAFSIANFVILVGFTLDGWAHLHLGVIDSFYTPWHALAYAGLIISLAVLGAGIFQNKNKLKKLYFARIAGSTSYKPVMTHTNKKLWSVRRAIPLHYDSSFFGGVIFVLSGFGDALWHTLFGNEILLNGIISPSHLGLNTGWLLLSSGPICSAWSKARSKFRLFSPLTLSSGMFITVIGLATEYMHPASAVWLLSDKQAPIGQSEFYPQALSLTSTVVFAALMTGFLLILLKRWPWNSWQFGVITFIFSLNTSVMLFYAAKAHYELLIATFIAGLTCDGLLHSLKPEFNPSKQVYRFRLFAFGVPFLFMTVYLIIVLLVNNFHTWWAIHFVLGTPVLGGLVGVLVSYLIMSPNISFVGTGGTELEFEKEKQFNQNK